MHRRHHVENNFRLSPTPTLYYYYYYYEMLFLNLKRVDALVFVKFCMMKTVSVGFTSYRTNLKSKTYTKPVLLIKIYYKARTCLHPSSILKAYIHLAPNLHPLITNLIDGMTVALAALPPLISWLKLSWWKKCDSVNGKGVAVLAS